MKRVKATAELNGCLELFMDEAIDEAGVFWWNVGTNEATSSRIEEPDHIKLCLIAAKHNVVLEETDEDPLEEVMAWADRVERETPLCSVDFPKGIIDMAGPSNPLEQQAEILTDEERLQWIADGMPTLHRGSSPAGEACDICGQPHYKDSLCKECYDKDADMYITDDEIDELTEEDCARGAERMED